MKKELVDYDTYDYDYSSYWKNRQYEHKAEVIVIEKFLKNVTGERFIDIGGSYGRLLPTYIDKYKKIFILDYSIKTLQRTFSEGNNHNNKVVPVAANVYKMPFKENSFDGGMMVRVLHHLEEQEKYFMKLAYILSSRAVFTQEIPNKIHLKSRISHTIKGDMSLFDMKPLQQSFFGGTEGAKGERVTFLNYHPSQIEQYYLGYDLTILEKVGCSFLRSTPFSKKLSLENAIKIEDFLQNSLNKTNLTPSIFYKLQNSGNGKLIELSKLEDIFACPQCNNDLQLTQHDKMHCSKCNKDYFKKKGVWDFRIS